MSELGQYVHYHWSRYLTYGTSQNDASQGIDNPKFIFNAYFDYLKNKTKNMPTKDIKTLEKQYNEANKIAYQKMIQMLSDDSTLMPILLKIINNSWNDVDIANIIQGIQFNNAQSTFKYKPPQGASAKISEKSIGIKKLDNNKTDRHYYKTCESRIEQIKAKAKEMQVLTQYSKKIKLLEDTLKERKITMNITNTFTKANNNLLPAGDELYSGINSLIVELQGAATIQGIIQAQLAEVLGNIAVKGLANAVNENLSDAIEGALQELFENKNGKNLTGRAHTSKDAVSVNLYSNLDQDWLKVNYEDDNSPFKTHIVAIKDDKTDAIIEYRFKDVAGKVQQKADIIWEGKAGISMKNTAFDFDNSPEDIIPTISLQPSALRVFLEGIEASHPTLGTHFLNTLASHPNRGDNINLREASESARKALLLYMLYASLTGEGQNRIGAMADVLAIYDKKKKSGAQQIKLFSMRDILLKIADGNILMLDGVISHPALSSFRLDNSYITSTDDQDDFKSARMRITKLLGEISIKKVSMRIPKQWLKDNFQKN